MHSEAKFEFLQIKSSIQDIFHNVPVYQISKTCVRWFRSVFYIRANVFKHCEQRTFLLHFTPETLISSVPMPGL